MDLLLYSLFTSSKIVNSELMLKSNLLANGGCLLSIRGYLVVLFRKRFDLAKLYYYFIFSNMGTN